MSASDTDTQRKVLNRLRRASGQLAAVVAAVERGDSCRDVVTQLAAVNAALNRAGFLIVASAMKDCVAGTEGDGPASDLTQDQLEKLFLTLA